MGPLTEPKIPDIPGLDSFDGPVFHSARWDHDVVLNGKRVASIGTGASAIQYVPEIQPKVAELHVFQRTAPWVLPHSNRPIRDWERRLYRTVPAAQRLVRGGVYAGREALVLGFVKNPRLMKVVERLARRHMEQQIDDPELLEKVTPDYTIGCKRILPSNRWYRALGKPNVELVTEGITEVRARSVVTADGREREVDAIVLGTGFHVTDIPAAHRIRGRGGVLARRPLARQPARAPGQHGGRLPEPVLPARPEHRARAQLDGLHDRVADRARDGGAAAHARARRADDRGPPRGAGALQRRARAPARGDGVEHRLRELVPGPDRPQLDRVARLDVAVPSPRRRARPGGVPARRGIGGADSLASSLREHREGVAL